MSQYDMWILQCWTPISSCCPGPWRRSCLLFVSIIPCHTSTPTLYLYFFMYLHLYLCFRLYLYLYLLLPSICFNHLLSHLHVPHAHTNQPNVMQYIEMYYLEVRYIASEHQLTCRAGFLCGNCGQRTSLDPPRICLGVRSIEHPNVLSEKINFSAPGAMVQYFEVFAIFHTFGYAQEVWKTSEYCTRWAVKIFE